MDKNSDSRAPRPGMFLQHRTPRVTQCAQRAMLLMCAEHSQGWGEGTEPSLSSQNYLTTEAFCQRTLAKALEHWCSTDGLGNTTLVDPAWSWHLDLAI